jgi:hypothetical protein
MTLKTVCPKAAPDMMAAPMPSKAAIKKLIVYVVSLPILLLTLVTPSITKNPAEAGF